MITLLSMAIALTLVLGIGLALPGESSARQTGAGVLSRPAFARATSVADGPSPGHATTPLDKLLNADGTLNTRSGFRGSIDARGYSLVSGPGEEPRFERVPASPDAPAVLFHWE